MNNPVISLCIPTYNRAKCLRQCLDSIVEQFKDPIVQESVEVVISNNASTDDTEKVAKEFQNQFSNIFYYKNNENIRVDRNILNVVEKAKGKYVWFLGDDDALFPGSINYMLQELELQKFKYCIVNCLGYDNNLLNPAVSHPNFALESNQYFNVLKDYVVKMDKKDMAGNFCGLSMQVFDRELWQSCLNKQEYVDSNAVHLFILLSVMKDQGFALIAKPLVKVRAANIRWETFPGLETLKKRADSTSSILAWILETYKIPHSKMALKIEQNKNLLNSWGTGVLRKYIFRSQGLRDFVKKILGKL